MRTGSSINRATAFARRESCRSLESSAPSLSIFNDPASQEWSYIVRAATTRSYLRPFAVLARREQRKAHSAYLASTRSIRGARFLL